MNPDIDLRLKSLEKALTDVITRAVPKNETLAHDQIKLVVGHLQILNKHWKYALRYELGTLDALISLAAKLVTFADKNTAMRLKDTSARIDAVDRTDFDEVTAVQRELSIIVDEIINARDSREPIPASMQNAVLEHYAWAAERERIWHQDCGLDPEQLTLAPLESIFQAPPN